MKNNKCSKCSHEWISRVKQPLQCPKCKRYDWNNTKTKIEQPKGLKPLSEPTNNLPKDNSKLWNIDKEELK